MAEARGSPRDSPRETEAPASKREAPKAGPNGETPATKREASPTIPTGETEQLVLTLSVATGEIVNVEKLDPAGQRHELTEAEYAKLAVDDVTDELEATLEEAYETGVADALGEDAEELALRGLVVGRLLVRGMLRHELGRQLLRRAIRRQILKRGLSRRSASR
jgi:hypothetical protein